MKIRDMAKEMEALIEDDFCKRLFQSSMANLKDKANPLRVNNFAYALRGLIDNMLHRLSPPNEIEGCVWFDKKIHTYDKNGKMEPSRSSQIKYAILGGVDDDLLSAGIRSDSKKHVKKLVSIYKELNGYTHIVEKTFNVTGLDAIKIIKATLGAVLRFLQLMAKVRSELYTHLEEKVFDIVQMQAALESVNELDEIASHYSIEEMYLHDFKIKSIDSNYIKVEAEGSIGVVHQFGSNSDLNNGDGLEVEHSHPFTSTIFFLCSEPAEWDEEETTFTVDTSDWYEGYYDEVAAA